MPFRSAVSGPRTVAAVAKYAPLTAYRDGAKYDATYVVLAVTATGVAKVACCQPLAVSPVKVTVPSLVPVPVHRRADVGAGARWPACRSGCR